MPYIGGNNQTIIEKRRRVADLLTPLHPVDMGYRWQCRCGRTVYVEYRKRYYCQNCGWRITSPHTVKVGDDRTFHEQFHDLKGKE
jgi:hypothetical protein